MDSDEQERGWMYAISPQFELSDKWQAFLEEYATFREDSLAKHYIDAGVGYCISDNVRLNVDGGKVISSRADDYFITAGISLKL